MNAEYTVTCGSTLERLESMLGTVNVRDRMAIVEDGHENPFGDYVMVLVTSLRRILPSG